MASQLLNCFKTPALRSYLAEFISTFLFIFIAVGSTISARMLTPDITSEASSLVATALAQGFSLFVMVYIAADVSGAHLNPAVTFAMAVCGRIAISTAIFYCIVQIVAATLACLLLHVASAGQSIPTTQITTEMTGFGGVILENVITFGLVYTVFVASEPRFNNTSKKQTRSVAGPLAVGLVAGAGILTAGSLTGASMNPARSLGPAIVSGNFRNQWVYWVGPLFGGSLAGVVHQYLVYPSTGSSLDDDVVV